MIRYGGSDHMIRYSGLDHMIRYGGSDHMIRYGGSDHMIRYGGSDHMIRYGGGQIYTLGAGIILMRTWNFLKLEHLTTQIHVHYIIHNTSLVHCTPTTVLT